MGERHLGPGESFSSDETDGFILPRDISRTVFQKTPLGKPRDAVVGVWKDFQDVCFLGQTDGAHDGIASVAICRATRCFMNIVLECRRKFCEKDRDAALSKVSNQVLCRQFEDSRDKGDDPVQIGVLGEMFKMASLHDTLQMDQGYSVQTYLGW